MFDLGLIHINRLIVHEVPRRFLRAESAGNGPVLSDVVSPLQNDVRNFFQERLVSTLSAAYDVEFDPSAQSTVPQVVEGLLREPPIEFVAASRDLANLLHASQGGVNPAGLLTLMDLTIGERAGLAIVKLEKEEGARVQHSRAGGHSTFNVSHLRDLMLTKKTKVFKVGLFAPSSDSGGIEGLVSDTQKGAGTTVAFFFLSQFLGCRLKEVPEVTTKRFFDATAKFINEDVDDPREKARYQVALVAELQNAHRSISPEGFANTNVATDDRPRFLERVAEEGVTARSFVKNASLVEPILHKIQWIFEGGISVMAPPSQVGEQLQVDARDDGRTRMEIVDKLRDVKGHR
jgi:hypothetical protein